MIPASNLKLKNLSKNYFKKKIKVLIKTYKKNKFFCNKIYKKGNHFTVFMKKLNPKLFNNKINKMMILMRVSLI
jgi:hypothetical protein